MMSSRKSQLVLALAFVALALPSLIGMSRMSANLDMLWLYEGMGRLLAGGTMSEVAYDPNPPLSFLIYLLPALFHKLTGVSGLVLATTQTVLLLTLGSVMMWRLLGCFSAVDAARKFAVVGAYLLGNIVLTGYSFGERDHLVGIILVPFVLFQMALTQKIYKPSRLGTFFIFTSALLFMLKPHLLIVPVSLWLHRLVTWRNRAALFSKDGIAITSMAVFYAAIIALFFRDYIDVILPDVLRYYVQPFVIPLLLIQIWLAKFQVLAIGAVLLSCMLIKGRGIRKMAMGLSVSALLAFVAALLQNKGFYYHLIPSLLFLTAAVPLLVMQIPKLNAVLALALTGGLMYGLMTGTPQAREQNAFDPNSPLVQEITKNTQPGDAFLLSAYGMQQIHETAYYRGRTHASRFPALWFLPELSAQQEKDRQGMLSPEERAVLQKDLTRFAGMVADDLETYQPKIVVLLYSPLGKGGLPQVLAGQPAFDSVWAAYKPAGQVSDSMTIPEQNLKYNRIFDVYLRSK